MLKIWHKFRFRYYHQLASDCLDETLKNKFLKKAEHHKEMLATVR